MKLCTYSREILDLGETFRKTRAAAQSRKYSTNRLTIEDQEAIFNHMVKQFSPKLDAIFHALGDSTRRQMLFDLSRGERTVSQLAEPFEISLAAVSKHIKALENAGLVDREVQGRTHICRLAPRPLAAAHEWLSYYQQFWNSRLDILENLLLEERNLADQYPSKEDETHE